MFVCAQVCAHKLAHMAWIREHPAEVSSVFPPYGVTGIELRFRLGSKHFYALSHLVGPVKPAYKAAVETQLQTE